MPHHAVQLENWLRRPFSKTSCDEPPVRQEGAANRVKAAAKNAVLLGSRPRPLPEQEGLRIPTRVCASLLGPTARSRSDTKGHADRSTEAQAGSLQSDRCGRRSIATAVPFALGVIPAASNGATAPSCRQPASTISPRGPRARRDAGRHRPASLVSATEYADARARPEGKAARRSDSGRCGSEPLGPEPSERCPGGAARVG